MNYLGLVQRLWLESGAGGTSPGPSAVAGQVGEYARLVTWTNAAWQDIQTAHQDWHWMRASASFTTVASTAAYTLGAPAAGTVGVTAATFGMWNRKTARSYDTVVGYPSEDHLQFIPYDDWRDTYNFGTNRTVTSRPIAFAIAPNRSICLGPVPAAGYTIELDYYTAPTDLAADADIPTLPAQFHMAIVWKALMMYGAYEAAPEAYQRGEAEFAKLMARLSADRLEEITWGPALA